MVEPDLLYFFAHRDHTLHGAPVLPGQEPEPESAMDLRDLLDSDPDEETEKAYGAMKAGDVLGFGPDFAVLCVAYDVRDEGTDDWFHTREAGNVVLASHWASRPSGAQIAEASLDAVKTAIQSLLDNGSPEQVTQGLRRMILASIEALRVVDSLDPREPLAFLTTASLRLRSFP